jgi:hypothetical protein
MPTIGLLGDHASDEIPSSHLDLIECPPVAALTTVMSDGYPQTSVVWCDFDAEHLDGLASKYAGRRSGSSATPSRRASPRPRSRCCAGSGRPRSVDQTRLRRAHLDW